MADIDGFGYPNDGTSEKDEILTSTKPGSYSAAMEDQAQDSQFEDAESDYTPIHSPIKSSIHAVRDDDSRDSGINHSESGSDRPEKQDLPESQYEDAEMDSNADPEEDNEPIETNGRPQIVDGYDEAEDLHDDENGEYTENDAPEENHIQENSENAVSELDVLGDAAANEDVSESQPEDESSMLVAVSMGDGDGEETAERSEEEVVEKYEEEEMHEKYEEEEEDHYGEESEQFQEDDQFYKPAQTVPEEGYVEENGQDDIELQPEDTYYAEQTAEESEPTLLDAEATSDLPEDYSAGVVKEAPEGEGLLGTHRPGSSLLQPEAEMLVDTGVVKEEVKTIALQKEDLREFESDLLHSDGDLSDTRDFIEQLDVHLNLGGGQMHFQPQQGLQELDDDHDKYDDAPESHADYPEERVYEEQDNRLISDIDLLGGDFQSKQPAVLDQKIQENLHIIASRNTLPESINTHGATTDLLTNSQFSDDLLVDDTTVSKNVSPQKKVAQEALLDKDIAPVEPKPKPIPTYTNFDDIPVGVAYNYTPPSPQQDDSAEADQGRIAKPATGPAKKNPGVGVKKGRGRGLNRPKQAPQQQAKTGGRGQTGVPKSSVQKTHTSDQRTLASRPDSNVKQDPRRRQPVKIADARQMKSPQSAEDEEGMESTLFDSQERGSVSAPKQEVRRKTDAPGTAVRVNRQAGQPQTSSSPRTTRTSPQQRGPAHATSQPGGAVSPSGVVAPGEVQRKSGGRDVWDDRRVASAERYAIPGMSPLGKEDATNASQKSANVQRRQQTQQTNKAYSGSSRQHLNASNPKVDEKPNRPVSPGIARRQPPPPDNISQAQSRRFAEYASSSQGKAQPKEYEYPESLDLENESRHSSGCTSPYHQPKQNSGSPSKTHSHNGHGFEQTESEHQPVCTCGQVVYDDIAESQAYLIERNKKKVAQRAAELQAKREEEEKRGDDKEEVYLRPTNRRRNSYELANRDISPTPEMDGENYGDRFRADISGRPATSKKDLEEPTSSARRYKLVDVEGVGRDSRDPQLSGLDHAKLAKLAERELADMERSRAVRERLQQQARQAYPGSQVSPTKQATSPQQASPKAHSPQKQATPKTASPARSGTSISSSPTKTLPSQSSSATSPAKSTSSAEGVKKGVAYGQPLYDKTGLRLSGVHSLDLSGDPGQERPEDQFMDADESDEEYDGVSREREERIRYVDADMYDQLTGEGGIGTSISEIQAAISQSKNMLLKSPTFYVEKEPEEPVWVLRPFYAKKQLQDEERRRQEQERERERESIRREEQRGNNRSPTSLGSSDDDLQNRNPQGYQRKDSDDEDDDVEQKPLMSTSDYETGSSSHDHIHSEECYLRNPRPREAFQQDEDLPPSGSKTKEVRGPHDPPVLEHGIIYPAGYLGSTQIICNKPPSKKVRMQQAQEAVSRIKAPDGETQPSTDVDIFISIERVKVLNADTEETMMDHPLKTISYIADIGNLLVIMARRRSYATTLDEAMEESGIAMGDQVSALPRGPKKIICHVFETEDAQLIAQSIGQAFSIAYLNFLKENGIDDPSVTEMDYGEVLSSQEIYGDDLMLFSNKECEKEILIEKERGEIMGIVIVESGWGSLVPTVVIANMSPFGAAARSGKLNIGDQIMSINGTSCVGLPLTTAQQTIKSLKNQCLVKFNVVSCPPVTQVIIKRPDVKYQLGFSVQNGTICSLMRGGIAERGGVRVGHRIIEINGMSVVATAHEKIVDILATAVGEIHMKTMPLSMYRLLTGQEQPLYL